GARRAEPAGQGGASRRGGENPDDGGDDEQPERGRRPLVAETSGEESRGERSERHEQRDDRDPDLRLVEGELLEEAGDHADPGRLCDDDERQRRKLDDRGGDPIAPGHVAMASPVATVGPVATTSRPAD